MELKHVGAFESEVSTTAIDTQENTAVVATEQKGGLTTTQKVAIGASVTLNVAAIVYGIYLGIKKHKEKKTKKKAEEEEAKVTENKTE